MLVNLQLVIGDWLLVIGDDEEIANNEDAADAVGENVDDYTHISGGSIGK